MGSWSGYFRVVLCLIFCLICSGTDTFQLTLVYSSSLCLQEEADCFGTAHVPSNMQRSPTCQDLDATQPRMPRTSCMARAWHAHGALQWDACDVHSLEELTVFQDLHDESSWPQTAGDNGETEIDSHDSHDHTSQTTGREPDRQATWRAVVPGSGTHCAKHNGCYLMLLVHFPKAVSSGKVPLASWTSGAAPWCISHLKILHNKQI